MHKNQKFISAIMAGLTLLSVAPIRAAEIEAVEEEPVAVETQDNVEVQVETEAIDNSVEAEAQNNIEMLTESKTEKSVLNEIGNIAKGVSGTIKWVLSEEGVLTVSPQNGISGNFETSTSGISPWVNYINDIKEVYIEPGVALKGNGSGLFRYCDNLTKVDLSNLDVSKTTKMNAMFYGCDLLTSLDTLANWDVQNVVDMSDMFGYCKSLTSLKGLENWKTNNVTTMSGLFAGCKKLNSLEALSDWNVSNVTNMEFMFEACTSLDTLKGLERWDVENVVNMRYMFGNRVVDKMSICDISAVSDWNLTKVTELSGLFAKCNKLASLDEIAGWNVESAINMKDMFDGCSSLTSLKPLAEWNTSNVTNMSFMFSECEKLHSLEPLAKWNTSNVTSMGAMFSQCKNLESLKGLENWNTSKVENMGSMFMYCEKLKHIEAISNWNTKSVKNMSYMFTRCLALSSLVPLSSWTTTNLSQIDGIFLDCQNLSTLKGIESWTTNNVVTMRGAFANCFNLQELPPLSTWNVENVTDMTGMFENCRNLITLKGLEDWNVKNVTKMGSEHSGSASISGMFQGCRRLQTVSALAKWNVSKVTDMSEMFSGCINLTSITPLKQWNTEKVTDMSGMFAGDNKIEEADFSNWKISPNKERMLYKCISLSQITVSSDSDFTNTEIPSLIENEEYTGNWAYGDPFNHNETLTGEEFSKGTHKAGTWYWEKKENTPVVTTSVSVAIKDNHNNFIEGATIMIANDAGEEVAKLATGKEALVLPESLVLNNDYTINIDSPFGYETIEPQKVTITGTTENPQTIEITLPLKKFNVTINATDSEGNLVSGGTASIHNAVTDALIDEVDMNPGKTVTLEYNPVGYYAIQTTVADGYRIDENKYEIKNDLSDQTITFINNLIEGGEPEQVPTDKPNNTNQSSNKVETGNYANIAIFAGTIAAVAVAIGIVLYFKKRNKDSEES